MRPAITIAIGLVLSAAGFELRAQIPPSQAVQAPKAAAQATQQSSPAPAGRVAPAQSTAAPKAAPKKTGKSSAKGAKPAATSANSAPKESSATSSAAAVPTESKVPRRDPFESLIGREKANSELAKNLPPGKAGLQVASLRLDGIVKSPNGMIAVVTNPQARTYFLREGDQLYDGRVEKIAMDGVSFHEVGKDAFGKPVERQVNKRIYSSAGEQQ